MGGSHASDFEKHSMSVDLVATDISRLCNDFDIEQCQTLDYSFGGLVSLVAWAINRDLTGDLARLSSALLRLESIDQLRGIWADCAADALSLLSSNDTNVDVTHFTT